MTDLPSAARAFVAWLRKYVVPLHAPLPAILAFSIGVAFAFSPNIVHVYGIHNDYEMLNFKSNSFFHPEAEALAAIARPVAALLTNLTVLPLQSLSDYRWTRIFSILTVCLMGSQLISLCIHRLRIGVIDAVAIALATFLVPPFIYSVLNASAWSPHLFSVLLVFVAYAILSSSNVLLPAFYEGLERRDHQLLLHQALRYARLKPIGVACAVYQFSLFDYPPNAMILALLPVVAMLFSRAPAGYRAVMAIRDIIFICANIVIFILVAKLVYLPIIRLFTSAGSGAPGTSDPGALAARIAATYRFEFNFDPLAAAGRLVDLLRVAGDLWFLPQTRVHLVLGAVMALAVVVAQLASRRALAAGDGSLLRRVAIAGGWLSAPLTFAISCTCFAIAGSAILASATGFITYRTIAVPTAILAVMGLFAVRGIVEVLAPARLADVAVGIVACGAIGANFYMNELTMRLARNEFAYFTAVVRQAVEMKSSVITIVDPRPFALPEDIPVVYDQRGRAVPPYELGCLSGYCMQSGSIVQIAARELGYPPGRFRVYNVRADEPVPDLTCEILTNLNAVPPANLPSRSRDVIRWYHSLAPMTCVTYSLEWHDVGIDLSR